MTMTDQVKVLARIAKVLDALPSDEARCAVMASACAHLGDYGYGQVFMQRAEHLKREKEAKPQ